MINFKSFLITSSIIGLSVLSTESFANLASDSSSNYPQITTASKNYASLDGYNENTVDHLFHVGGLLHFSEAPKPITDFEGYTLGAAYGLDFRYGIVNSIVKRSILTISNHLNIGGKFYSYSFLNNDFIKSLSWYSIGVTGSDILALYLTQAPNAKLLFMPLEVTMNLEQYKLDIDKQYYDFVADTRPDIKNNKIRPTISLNIGAGFSLCYMYYMTKVGYNFQQDAYSITLELGANF